MRVRQSILLDAALDGSVLEMVFTHEEFGIAWARTPARFTRGCIGCSNPGGGRGRPLKRAQHVWAAHVVADDPLPLGHDGYLKVWALSQPRLPVDDILLEEAQDTNPVVLDVLTDQDAQMIYVGDKDRRICTEWRGAINAMDEAGDPLGLSTTSFRFAGEIAEAANRLLQMLDATEGLVTPCCDQRAIIMSGAVAASMHRSLLCAHLATRQMEGSGKGVSGLYEHRHRGYRSGAARELGRAY